MGSTCFDRGKYTEHRTFVCINCTSKHSIQPIPAAKTRRNAKFAAFWRVFLTKIKLDPESWCN